MSSHREAPEISKDPVADGTDVYAFVSPDKPSTVTLIANFIPLQKPDGGPNFYEFGDDVLYEIHVANDGKAEPDVTYQFRFNTRVRRPSFLYNTGQITSISDPNWNRPQYYSVTRIKGGKKRVLGTNLPCPPVNVGNRSTPNYGALAAQAVRFLPGGKRVFAGQRADAFHVDLGSIFDLGALRPFNEAHVINMPEMNGRNAVQSYNVHTHRPAGPDDRAHPQRSSADRRDEPGVDHRGVGDGEPPEVAGLQPQGGQVRRRRALEAGVPTRQPARQRGAHPDEPQGCVEHPAAQDRQGLREVRLQARARRVAALALPGCLPEPGRLHQEPCRPARDPAHRHPRGGGGGVPELHRTHPGRHAAAEHGRARRPTTPTRSVWWPATRPASPTDAG